MSHMPKDPSSVASGVAWAVVSVLAILFYVSLTMTA